MSSRPAPNPQDRILLPAAPALAVNPARAALLTQDGEIRLLSHDQARQALGTARALICHARHTSQKLGMGLSPPPGPASGPAPGPTSDQRTTKQQRTGQAALLPAYDVLELFAFVHPAVFCVPTPAGLAKALGIAPPQSLEDEPPLLIEIAKALLADIRNDPWQAKANPAEIARVMGMQGKGWVWTPFICAALGVPYDPAIPAEGRAALNIWKHLPEWAEDAPPPPPSHHGVTREETRDRLALMLKSDCELRPQQAAYAQALTEAFLPPLTSAAQAPDGPGQGSPAPEKSPAPGKKPAAAEENHTGTAHAVLAEAGTGIGKTLGYLAPASLWAEKNKGPVWISTYTKNLQRQIEQELDRLYPDPEVKNVKLAIRKGRENYLCLLNLEESCAGAALARTPAHAVAAGMMARWAAATKDGDLSGGDFPGWLPGLLGYAQTRGLADRRGECLYAACDHYHRCFVERSIRKARHADIVIANHALVMIQTALSAPGDEMPGRYIFDEGHHLFDAADSAYAGHLTARETYDLRRWIRGAESGRKSRARGLKRRAEDLVAGDPKAEQLLQDILHASTCLSAEGWAARLKEGAPKGPAELFIYAVYEQVWARAQGRHGPYSLETQTHPLADGMTARAAALKTALVKLQTPLLALAVWMRRKLAEQGATLDSDTRKRLESVAAALERRGHMTLAAWIAMLETLLAEPPAGSREPGDRNSGTAQSNKNGQDRTEQFVDWMEIERIDSRATDIGLYRHWVDPTIPFARSLEPHLHGIAVTSATLRDSTGEENEGWEMAKQRSAIARLSDAPLLAHFSSPFFYAQQTRIFVITDLDRDDLDQVAGAYKTLLQTSGGGALGLFTAISRLRGVYERIARPLEKAGLALYAQHIDAVDTGTLVDIFREDIDASLLGTDAIRDGVDVPGESLRLIVFDRVPWPRPNILHKARREAFGKKRYDDMLTRLKLKQAYGRLIRRAGDRGVFVMLDSRLPSRLHSAFPETVPVQRVGLAAAATEIKAFLSAPNS